MGITMQYQFKHAEHSNLTKVQHQELISEKSGITLSGKCMNPADDTDGDLLASALKGNKSDFFYKYHSAGPKAYKEASLATKAKDGICSNTTNIWRGIRHTPLGLWHKKKRKHSKQHPKIPSQQTRKAVVSFYLFYPFYIERTKQRPTKRRKKITKKT